MVRAKTPWIAIALVQFAIMGVTLTSAQDTRPSGDASISAPAEIAAIEILLDKPISVNFESLMDMLAEREVVQP